MHRQFGSTRKQGFNAIVGALKLLRGSRHEVISDRLRRELDKMKKQRHKKPKENMEQQNYKGQVIDREILQPLGTRHWTGKAGSTQCIVWLHPKS